MPTTDFSGRDIAKVLLKYGYERRGRTGSHLQLRDVTDEGEVRNVTIPMYDRIDVDLLQDIADQCGANDFQKWCEWIDENR